MTLENFILRAKKHTATREQRVRCPAPGVPRAAGTGLGGADWGALFLWFAAHFLERCRWIQCLKKPFETRIGLYKTIFFE